MSQNKMVNNNIDNNDKMIIIFLGSKSIMCSVGRFQYLTSMKSFLKFDMDHKPCLPERFNTTLSIKNCVCDLLTLLNLLAFLVITKLYARTKISKIIYVHY